MNSFFWLPSGYTTDTQLELRRWARFIPPVSIYTGLVSTPMGPRSTVGPSSKGHTRVKFKLFSNWKMDSSTTDVLKCSVSSTEPTF